MNKTNQLYKKHHLFNATYLFLFFLALLTIPFFTGCTGSKQSDESSFQVPQELTVTEEGEPIGITQLREKAVTGLDAAQLELGLKYLDGEDIDTNYKKAFQCFNIASQSSDSDIRGSALFYMGACYEAGFGTLKDGNKAVEHYRKSAEEGCAKGKYGLASCYLNGSCGVSKNESLAFKYMKEAADQGVIGAIYSLGLMYYYGQGTKKDVGKSDELLALAANNGYGPAQLLFGITYYNNNDFSNAVLWLKKAGAQKFSGVDVAYLYLGKCYETGCGTYWNANKEEARSWYEKAANMGNEDAKICLGKMK